MATEIASVFAKIGADTSGLKQGLEDAGGKLDGFSKKLAGIATAIGAAFAVKKVIGWVSDAVEAANEDVSAMTRLGLAVENTGANFEEARGKIDSFIAAQMKSTTYSDGEQMAAIQSLTEMTGDYNQALDLTKTAMDLAAATGMDLASASKLVGRVSKGDTGLLKRYGIVIDDNASAMEALTALQTKYAGQAEAAGRSGAGAAKRLGNAWGEVKDTLVSNLAPAVTDIQNKLADFLFDNLPAIQQFADAVGGFIGPAFEKVAGFATSAFDVITKLLSGELNWSSLGIPQFVIDGFNNFKTILGDVKGIFGTVIKGLLEGDSLGEIWKGKDAFFDVDTGLWQEATPGLQAQFRKLGNDIVDWIADGLIGATKILDDMATRFSEWALGDGKLKAEQFGKDLAGFMVDSIKSLLGLDETAESVGGSTENMLVAAIGKINIGATTLFAAAVSGLITGTFESVFGESDFTKKMGEVLTNGLVTWIQNMNILTLAGKLIEQLKNAWSMGMSGLSGLGIGAGARGGSNGGTYKPHTPSLIPQSFMGGNNITIHTSDAHGVVLELKRLGAI